MRHLYILLSILLISLNNYGQKSVKETLNGNWFVELQHNDIGAVRTIMQFNSDNNAFTAHTRKHADKDILGGWKAFLGRTFTKGFKGGSLLVIEKGQIKMANDSIILLGILNSALGSYYFKGYVLNDVLHAQLLDFNKEKIGKITATKKEIKTPLENYPALFDKAVALTKERIYNQSLLQSKEWKSFEINTRNVSVKVQDDLEMVFAYFYNASKLPVSHYALMKIPDEKDTDIESTYKAQVFLEEKTSNTAYLKIKSFGGTAKEMDSIFTIIKQKSFANLIVDLRDNPGGSVAAGMTFASNVVDSSYYGGVFLTQKWFNAHDKLPTVKEYSAFPHFSAANFDLIISGIHSTDGLCLKVIPNKTVYKGKLFILTNRQTASTCEPLVYVLKQHKLATIVGETTAGAMMNGEILDLDKGFKMIIPTADYYTSDGYRIDKKGVVPNIIVKENEALEYVQQKLIK
jgi:hypothetical protein